VIQIVSPSGSADSEDDDDDDHDDHRKRDAFSGASSWKRELVALPKRGSSQGNLADVRAIQVDGQTIVSLNGFGYNNKTVHLDNKCVASLNWPVQILDNTKREDVTFIAFQVWVLGMSLVALLNESIPHVLASLLTHMSATAWGGFQISSTSSFHDNFQRLTTQGACGINLLPNYWTARGKAEIPSLALNVASLLVSSFLSWRLIKLFGWQTFKRVGASLAINRMYKLVLSLSIAIQLSLFFVVVSISLWLDQIYHGAIGHMAMKAGVYKAVFVVVLLLLFPWLFTGWIAVRRELKIPMMIFLVLSCLYLVGWGALFSSYTFRWTFVQWRFFSVIVSLSVFLALMSFILGLACRFNFGKGLPRYLNAQEPLPGDDFIPVVPGEKGNGDPEKVDFPSTDRPIPTFSATFGSGLDVPPPSQMRFPPRQMGPRFTNSSAQPFELQVDTTSIATPPVARHGLSPDSAVSRNSSSPTSGRNLIRHGSSSSQQSFSSMVSSTERQSWGNYSVTRMSSKGSSSGESIGRSRWVIE